MARKSAAYVSATLFSFDGSDYQRCSVSELSDREFKSSFTVDQRRKLSVSSVYGHNPPVS
jgi:hypothetical protein